MEDKKSSKVEREILKRSAGTKELSLSYPKELYEWNGMDVSYKMEKAFAYCKQLYRGK